MIEYKRLKVEKEELLGEIEELQSKSSRFQNGQSGTYSQ